MSHDELVLRVFHYRRNVGVTLGEIRSFVSHRESTKHTKAHDRAAVLRLERDRIVVSVGEKWFLTPAGYKLARGSSIKPEWQSEDSWILLAAFYNRQSGGFELPNLVAAADFINHAIPTLEEMHGSINRLLAGRLIKTKRCKFLLTDTALAMFETVKTIYKNSVLDQLDTLRRLLNCPCCGVKLKSVRWRYQLDASGYSIAVNAYREMTP